MAPSYPPKKSAPTPGEQTTESPQHAPQQDVNTTPKARRFAPQPVEHAIKSFKDVKTGEATHEEKPKLRKFAPEPVEHSVKSSKDVKNGEAAKDEKPKPRKFAPQMVEESVKSSTDVKPEKSQSHVKFKPEPIATTYGSNRKSRNGDANGGVTAGPRKFAPILLDTAKRSRRATDKAPALSQTDKTEAGFHIHAREYRRHITGEVTPAPGSAAGSEDDDCQSEYSISPTLDKSDLRRRSPSPLDGSPGPRRASLLPQRQHSYHMPDLDTIESSESEREPSPRSLSPNPNAAEGSPITASASGDSFEFYKHATRIRESVDENFSHYLLDLERKKAQRRLEEQALAAYPNPDFGYEAPRHYGINEDDESSEDMEVEERPVTWEGHEDDLIEMARRESTAKGNWEQMEMQRHAEDLKQERNAIKTTEKKTTDRASPWWTPPGLPKEEEADKEMRSMRDRARPPMLGGDIVFPRCPSPDPARFDVTQGPATLRNQMCYLTEAAEYERKRTGEEGGLWHGGNRAAQIGEKRKSSGTATPTSPSSAKKSESGAKGLWGGFCVDDGSTQAKSSGGLTVPSQPTGLMTPKPETAGQANPFEMSFAAPKTGPIGGVTTPPTPANLSNTSDLNRIDSVLTAERDLDRLMAAEFPDSFITQVYNYLSLGYPSLARPFDAELAKISRFDLAELRSDDVKARNSPRGYIRLGADFEGGGGEGLVEEECVRWRALKRYVREWAKQEKGNLAWGGEEGGNWGTGARRGSWAI